MSANEPPLLGVAPEHLPSLLAALCLLLLLPLGMRVARRACGRGLMPAVYFVRGYHSAAAAVRLAAVLIALSGVVHLAIAFGHHGPLAGWLVLDGLALLSVSASAFLLRWWRPVAALLLGATILAYLAAVGRGAEAVDQLGIATKTVELTALGLVLLPRGLPVRHRRLSWATMTVTLVLLGVLSGAVPWAASFRTHTAGATATHLHADGALHRHNHSDGVSRVATSEEAEAAARLVAETRAATVRYADLFVALADGYRPALEQSGDAVHYENKRFAKDSNVLDPARPESLVYVKTPDGPLLAGVVYAMPRPGMHAPRPGGPITTFHTHSICIAPSPPWIAGMLSPFGACPAGSVNIVTPEMMHVWLLEGMPGGPFAQELDKKFLKSLTSR